MEQTLRKPQPERSEKADKPRRRPKDDLTTISFAPVDPEAVRSLNVEIPAQLYEELDTAAFIARKEKLPSFRQKDIVRDALAFWLREGRWRSSREAA